MKKNFKNIIITSFTLIILYILFFVPLPYYIEKTGGLISLNERIKIDDKNIHNNLYMSYVSEIKATIPLCLISLLNKNWDLVQEENYGKKSDLEFSSKFLAKESFNNAIISVFKLLGNDYKINNRKIYVLFIDDISDTNLVVGDRILKINNKTINNKNDINDIVKMSNIGEELNIEVVNNGKTFNRKAKVLSYKGNNKLGIIVGNELEISSNPEIKISFKNNEFGSSGGLMMALTIYSELSDIDIVNGRKIAGTGTIDENGIVGEISGIKYKVRGAAKENAEIFIVPKENYNEAYKTVLNENLNIRLIVVDTLEDAINKLKEG